VPVKIFNKYPTIWKKPELKKICFQMMQLEQMQAKNDQECSMEDDVFLWYVICFKICKEQE